MSRVRETARQAIILSSARILAVVLSLASVVYYSRYVDAEGFAVLLSITILSELCNILCNLGLGDGVARRVPALQVSDPQSAHQFVGALIWITAPLTLLFGVAVALASGPLAAGLLKDPGQSMLVMAAIPAIFVRVWSLMLTYVLRANGKFTELGAILVVGQVLIFISVVCGHQWLGNAGLALGMAAGPAIPNLVATIRCRRLVPLRLQRSAIRGHVVGCVPYYLEGLVNYGYRFADQWVVGLFLTPTDVAIYYVPRVFCERLVMIRDSLGVVLVTALSSASGAGKETARRGFNGARRVHLYVFAPVVALTMVSTYLLLDVVSGGRFVAGTAAFVILLGFYFMTSAFSPHAVGIEVLGRPVQRLQAVIVQTVILLTVLPLLAWLWGIEGVALARMLGAMGMAAASWIMLKRILDLAVDWRAVRIVLSPSLVILLIGAGGQWLYYTAIRASMAGSSTGWFASILASRQSAVTWQPYIDWTVSALIIALAGAVGGLWLIRRLDDDDIDLLDRMLPHRLGMVLSVVRRLRTGTASKTAAAASNTLSSL